MLWIFYTDIVGVLCVEGNVGENWGKKNEQNEKAQNTKNVFLQIQKYIKRIVQH